jgi:hypothetical protein
MKLRLLFLQVFLFVFFRCLSQELPKVQKINLRAPLNIKIYGQDKEPDAPFQAYNNATEIFYSVLNDDENLYLRVKATKPRIIEKIISVGITLIVNSKGQKNNKDLNNISITYPIIAVSPGYRILSLTGNRAIANNSNIPGMPIDTNDKPNFSPSDSLKALANKSIVSNAKEIKIKGAKGITDTLVSIYNEEKIRVAAAFDTNGAYIYELAVPLKYLELFITDPKIFTYSVKIAGRLENPKYGLRVRYVYTNGVQTDVDQDLNSTTQFWGEYVLKIKE